MSLDVSINLNSLKLIKEQLDDCISQASTEFEAYLANQADQTHIDHSINSMVQVAGTFKLLEFPGAALLSEEIALLQRVIADTETNTTDQMLGAVTHNLFVLPRYIEYLSIRHSALPILLIPYINELRICRKAKLLSESHFIEGFKPSAGVVAQQGSPQLETLKESAPRLRHMFQVGLLGIISKKPPSPYFAELIHRSVSRISAMVSGHPSSETWQVIAAFTACLANQTVELTLSRKRYLATIEKLLRAIIVKGEEGLSSPLYHDLKQDLLFVIALNDSASPQVLAIKQAYSLNGYDLTDLEIAQEREKMYGPSIDTIESLVRVIKEELHHIKDILEIASQNNAIQAEDHKLLLTIINRIADTLSMLNLSGPAALLRVQAEKISAWLDKPNIDPVIFSEAADTLLFIEGALSSLERHAISVPELNSADEEMRTLIITKFYLAEAQRVVLEEAETGITLSKRAINSYVDSNFDVGHIANISATLSTVRGCLKVLNYPRAAAILKSCSDFIDNHIDNNSSTQHRPQLLETLADALITTEYYLAEIATGYRVNEKILDVAEESLAVLGVGVEPAIQ